MTPHQHPEPHITTKHHTTPQQQDTSSTSNEMKADNQKNSGTGEKQSTDEALMSYK